MHPFSTFLLFFLAFLAMAVLPFASADVLTRQLCFCRKHLAGKSGSFTQLEYYNEALNGTILIERTCHSSLTHHCVGTSPKFLSTDKECNRDKSGANEFCYNFHPTRAHSYTFNGNGGDLPLKKAEALDDMCTSICKREFDLPVCGGHDCPTSKKEAFYLHDEESH
ncbi:hypothetical protein MMC08_000111 [Hypocenomyce scalaris]|nr:hypothetical protein [Hypocenomyce scalaris]